MSFLPFFPSLLEEMGIRDKAAVSVWSGMLFGAAPLMATVSSPIWGSIGDRLGRKFMVVRAMTAIAIFVGAMYWAQSPWVLFALRLAQGMFSGFIPPSVTLVSVQAPEERQGRVAGDLQTALALGAILGPMVGGIFAASGQNRIVFLFVGVCAFFSAALVVFLAHEDRGKRHQPEVPSKSNSIQSLLGGAGRDVREVFQNRSMRAMIFMVFFLQFGLGSTNPLLELHVRDLISTDAFETGIWASLLAILGKSAESEGGHALATSLLFSGMAMSNLVTVPIWGRYGDRAGHRQALLLCAGGAAFALGMQAFASLFWLLFVGRMLMGIAMAGSGPLAFGMAAGEIAVDKRGGAFGVVFSARTLAVALGSMTGGLLASFLGIRGLMWLTAAMIGVSALFFAGSKKRL